MVMPRSEVADTTIIVGNHGSVDHINAGSFIHLKPLKQGEMPDIFPIDESALRLADSYTRHTLGSTAVWQAIADSPSIQTYQVDHITRGGTARPVGVASLHRFHDEQPWALAETMSAITDPAAQRKGFGSMVRYGLANLALDSGRFGAIAAVHASDNLPSRRISEKLGYLPDSTYTGADRFGDDDMHRAVFPLPKLYESTDPSVVSLRGQYTRDDIAAAYAKMRAFGKGHSVDYSRRRD